jgi:hypothetical protein
MVAELGWPRVDFNKMDIEGAERHGLRAAGSVLARWKPRILIDMCRPADGSTVLPQVIRASNGGYRMACQTCEFHPDDGRTEPHVPLFF